jgi:hypothetical protein
VPLSHPRVAAQAPLIANNFSTDQQDRPQAFFLSRPFQGTEDGA